MSNLKVHRTLYGANFALLMIHEIDSAYWQEWNLFGLPGGIPFFLIANLALLCIGLFGYHRLMYGDRSGNIFSLFLALSGLFALGIHSYFMAQGHLEFATPTSEILLLLILSISAAQAIVAGQRFMRPSSISAPYAS